MTTIDDDLDALPSAPRRSTGLGSLLFRPPTEEPEEEGLIPAPSSSPETTSHPGPLGSSPSASGYSDEPSSGPLDGDPTSSPGSWAADDEDAGGPAGPLDVVGKASLKKTFRQGVLVTGGVAHKFAARTEGQQAVGLYLADDEDAKGIGDPLAEIAHRRGGVAGKLSPDANNALQAAMAFGGYIAKQIANLRLAAEHDQAHAPAADPQTVPGVPL